MKNVTAEEMEAAAQKLTEQAKFDAEQERRGEWDKCIEHVWDAGDADSLFERARTFFLQAAKTVSEGGAPARRPFVLPRIVKLLAFNFHYDYTAYDWDGNAADLDDDAAFGTEYESEELDEATEAGWVVDALEEYLLTGATKAKEVGSDTYAAWRKAFVELNYRFDRFDEGADEKNVKAFLAGIQTAAQLLWVDIRVQKRLLPPVAPVTSHKGGRRKKALFKKGGGGGRDR